MVTALDQADQLLSEASRDPPHSQGREQENVAVNNGLHLKHISKYGYKNGFFYLPAGRAPTNPGEASVNC